ncbi:hypothetical protein ACLOJK_036143 [Asimina triloba]
MLVTEIVGSLRSKVIIGSENPTKAIWQESQRCASPEAINATTSFPRSRWDSRQRTDHPELRGFPVQQNIKMAAGSINRAAFCAGVSDIHRLTIGCFTREKKIAPETESSRKLCDERTTENKEERDRATKTIKTRRNEAFDFKPEKCNGGTKERGENLSELALLKAPPAALNSTLTGSR